MPTDELDPSVDTSEQTPEEDSSADSDTIVPADADPTDVDELKEKLAAAEAEVKRWKGRVKKETQKPKSANSDYITKEDLWLRDNKDRIELVKEQYESLLEEGFEGETVSPSVALALAERQAGVSSGNSVARSRQNDMTVPDSMKRIAEGGVELSEYDKRLGLTAEKKKQLLKEYPELANR